MTKQTSYKKIDKVKKNHVYARMNNDTGRLESVDNVTLGEYYYEFPVVAGG